VRISAHFNENLPTLQMEVGIEDCLHIEFEYSKGRYALADTVVGKIYFLLVRIRLKHMEIEIRRRETTGASPFLRPAPLCKPGLCGQQMWAAAVRRNQVAQVIRFAGGVIILRLCAMRDTLADLICIVKTDVPPVHRQRQHVAPRDGDAGEVRDHGRSPRARRKHPHQVRFLATHRL